MNTEVSEGTCCLDYEDMTKNRFHAHEHKHTQSKVAAMATNGFYVLYQTLCILGCVAECRDRVGAAVVQGILI